MSLKRLWDLQELDLALEGVTGQMEQNPLYLKVEEAAARLLQVESALERAERDLREQRKKLRRGELDLEAITAEHGELHRRLYGGEVKNIKELEQMEIKLRSVRQSQLALEDKLLGLMEAMEDQEELLRELSDQRREAAAWRQEQQHLLDEDLARLGSELAALQERRDGLAARVEPKHLEIYRGLARRHQGRGVARVINDICQGCSVFISSAQRGFLYDPLALIYCENCGRLLVRFTEEEARAGRAEGPG